MIADHVTFKSSFFEVEPGEDAATNPGIYGKALAAWVAGKLRSRGVSVEGIIEEDFGRAVMVQRRPFMLWIACSSLDDSTTEWQMFIAAEFTLMARLLRRADPGPAIASLSEHLHAIVDDVPGVSDVQWG